MTERLNDASIDGWLERHPGWKRNKSSIERRFEFKSFRDAIVFVNRLASLADEADHHPDIDIRYNRIRVSLSTHDAGGVTEKDLHLAERIEVATSK